ncbi:hypothetical protein EJB05_48146, partial [Eragrostis curvula]
MQQRRTQRRTPASRVPLPGLRRAHQASDAVAEYPRAARVPGPRRSAPRPSPWPAQLHPRPAAQVQPHPPADDPRPPAAVAAAAASPRVRQIGVRGERAREVASAHQPGKPGWRQWTSGWLATLARLGWFLLAPLLAAYALRGLPQVYFNIHLRRHVRRLLPFLDPFVTIDIVSKPDIYIDRIKSSDAYEEVKAYVSTGCLRGARELRAEGALEGDGFILSLREGQEVADEFHGVTVWWSSVLQEKEDRVGQVRSLRLTFHQRHRELIVHEYLPHVRRSGRSVMFRNRRRRLYTNKKSLEYAFLCFFFLSLSSNSTMYDPDKKTKIMGDLDDFCNNKDYYSHIGKAWKRGYLLYGPPGTGKSTMIAAMANYLDFDIYDIELTMVRSNKDLRKLLIETTGKSIIVIEDIDCSLDLTGQRSTSDDLPVHIDIPTLNNKKRARTSEVTLSGLLNFIDGIWSAHIDEQIIVFTTNYVDKLDPALIRCGRMDLHVEMSYCCFEAFTTLAKNYLGIDEHPLFAIVKELLQAVEIIPADVAKCLMTSERTNHGADACLEHLINELEKKAEEEAAAKANGKGNGDMTNFRGVLEDGGNNTDDTDDYDSYSSEIDKEKTEEEAAAKADGKGNGDMTNVRGVLEDDGNNSDNYDSYESEIDKEKPEEEAVPGVLEDDGNNTDDTGDYIENKMGTS